MKISTYAGVILAVLGILFAIYKIYTNTMPHQTATPGIAGIGDTIVVVSIFIKNKDNALLVLHYGSMHPSDLWTVPKGVTRIKRGDAVQQEYIKTSFVQTVVKERTGLSVSNIRQFSFRETNDQEDIFFLVDATGGVITLPPDSTQNYTEYAWVTRDELRTKVPNDIYLSDAELNTIFGR